MKLTRISRAADDKPGLNVDPLKLQVVKKDVWPLVQRLDRQIEIRDRAPDGSEKQRLAQLAIDEIEQDIAFFANKDLGISANALAAMIRAEHMPKLKRSIAINAESLAKAEDRLAVATAEMRFAEEAYREALARGRAARKELREAKIERDLIAAGCEVL